MLKKLFHHGLKPSSRPKALCRRQTNPSIRVVFPTRRFHGIKTEVEEGERTLDGNKEARSDSLSFIDHKFKDYVPLDRRKPEHKSKNRHAHKLQSSEALLLSGSIPTHLRRDEKISEDEGTGGVHSPRTRKSSLFADSSEAQSKNTFDAENPLPASDDTKATAKSAEEVVQYSGGEEHIQKGGYTVGPYLRRVSNYALYKSAIKEFQDRQGFGLTRRAFRLIQRKPSLRRRQSSTGILEAELRFFVERQVGPRTVLAILEILIQDRKVKPSTSHYESLILAQCSPEFGSVDNLKAILGQMERDEVAIETSILLALLTVLSVHPDTYFRHEILDRLAAQQASLPVDHAHLNVLAAIREGQLEIATAELERMSEIVQEKPIPVWLWTVYIHAICEEKDFAALLQLLYKLSDAGFLFPRPTLLHLLVKASAAKDIHVTQFIWDGFVESMHIIPDDDLCMSVLHVAVKEKDLRLAESVAVVLECVAGNKETDPPGLSGDPDRKPVRRRMSMSNPSHQQESDAVPISETQELEESTPGVIDKAVAQSASNVDNIDDFDFKPIELSEIDTTGQSYFDPSVFDGIDPSSINWSPIHLRMTQQPDFNLALEYSTPRLLPNPTFPTPPLRPVPAEALQLLHQLGITWFDPEPDSSTEEMSRANTARSTNRGRRFLKGNLFQLFRADVGLAKGRFDPRLALLKGREC